MKSTAVLLLVLHVTGVCAWAGDGILARSVDAALACIARDDIPQAMDEIRIGINCHWYEKTAVDPSVSDAVARALAAETLPKHRAAVGVCQAVVLLAGAGGIDRAIAALDAAAIDDPDLPEIYNTRGVCYAAKRDLGKAIADYRQAIALNDRYLDALTNLASALAKTGDAAGATAAMERAQRLLAQLNRLARSSSP